MQKGIFWLIDGRIVAIKVPCDAAGRATVPCAYSSKSGQNFAHRVEWDRLPRRVTRGLPFDYYPRGRVEIRDGRVTIWAAPQLTSGAPLQAVLQEFGLTGAPAPVRVKADGSCHYRSVAETDGSLDQAGEGKDTSLC